jgi:5-methylcytosine-specific restriction endonuclease McrA
VNKRPCLLCDADFEARRGQRFCSVSCAQTYRQAIRRQQAGYTPPPRQSGSRARPTPPRDWQQQKLRAQLLPAAEGQPCALCGYVMHRTHRLALDHVVPVAIGGQTVIGNVRIVHYRCNHLAGSQLGNTRQHRPSRNGHKIN